MYPPGTILPHAANQQVSVNPASQVTTQPSLDLIAEMARQALSGLPSAAKPAPVAAPVPAPAPLRTSLSAPSDPRGNKYQQPKLDPRSNLHNQRQTHNAHATTYAEPASTYSNPQPEEDDEYVTIQDLSPMIQYSLKNLEATGHLDTSIGTSTIRWLNKLSEPEALQSLERFSSCDVSAMRSKEGYLSGILKKAIEKKNGF